MSDERKTFEKWYPVNDVHMVICWDIRSITRPDKYANPFTQLAWEAWQAAQAPVSAEPTPELAAHNAMLRAALAKTVSKLAHKSECASPNATALWEIFGSWNFKNCCCLIKELQAALDATHADVDVWKAKAYVLAVESGSVVLNAKQFDHFEECMTKLTTTASGMVTAAAQMLEFSKQSRPL